VKLTHRSEYALLALIFLARRSQDGGLYHADQIAHSQRIPVRFLLQILFTLKKAAFVRSVKGRNGGYELARSPDAITVAEIVRLIDGPLAPTPAASQYFYGPSPIEGEPKALQLMREIRGMVATKLEATTLADLV
jgi:Rrf2 family transcriptional regulator, cysteine metabolism repressor